MRYNTLSVTIHYALQYVTMRYNPSMVTIRYATLQYVTILYDTLQYVTILYDTLQYVMIRYDSCDMLRYVTIRYATLWYVMICYNTLWYVTIRYDMLQYVMIKTNDRRQIYTYNICFLLMTSQNDRVIKIEKLYKIKLKHTTPLNVAVSWLCLWSNIGWCYLEPFFFFSNSKNLYPK